MPDQRALVVDDSPTIRRLVLDALGRIEGLACTEAGDGAEGIQKASQGSFDIVVTDLNMPTVNDLGLVTWLRAQP
ncbi:MAG: response regulator, partial [Deltaproteobacteria bacterium]